MNAEALLDILHYLFEEDLMASASGYPETTLRKDGIRKTLYEKIYDRAYRVPGSQEPDSEPIPGTAHGSDGDNDDDLDRELQELAAMQVTARKKYIPPTDMDPSKAKPFGDVLDGPMGG
jgi:hypothetical protein